MSETEQNFYLITLPGDASPTDFDQFVNNRLAYCLKHLYDHVVLDISQIDSFQRMHLNIINRWLRNLQSLGGSLSIIGADSTTLGLFRSAKISGACGIFSTIDEFRRRHTDAELVDVTLPEPPEIQNGQAEYPAAEAPPPQVETETADSAPGKTRESRSGHEGSITESIDIRALEKMGLGEDVSSSLTFLNGAGNGGSEKKEPISREEHHDVVEQEESVSASPALEPWQDESEFFSGFQEMEQENYPESVPDLAEEGNSATSPIEDGQDRRVEDPETAGADVFIPADMEDERPALESFPEAFPGQEEVPAPGLEEFHDLPRDGDEQPGKIESSLDEMGAVEPSKPADIVADTSIRPEHHNTGVVNTLADLAGEYRCLECGQPDYFMKGYRFTRCSHPGCRDNAKGWEAVLILF